MSKGPCVTIIGRIRARLSKWCIPTHLMDNRAAQLCCCSHFLHFLPLTPPLEPVLLWSAEILVPTFKQEKVCYENTRDTIVNRLKPQISKHLIDMC